MSRLATKLLTYSLNLNQLFHSRSLDQAAVKYDSLSRPKRRTCVPPSKDFLT